MPRKTPYSGKQKKKQLQEKKLKKQSGPSYLKQDSDGEDEEVGETQSASHDLSECGQTELDRNESSHLPEGEQKVPAVQKVNLQPQRRNTTDARLDANRLHFFKEDAEIIRRRMKEARKPVKFISEEHREWTLEDAYPANAKLDFPKRPPWSYSASKEELEKREQQYFEEYVQSILDQPRAQDLSFFEVNLETWRQLWRVLEMSDILLIIADIRYPTLHVPPRLLDYVMKSLNKQTVIVLNKVDLVSPCLTLAWKRYMEDSFSGVHVVFFSSSPREVQLSDGLDPSAILQKRPFHTKTFPVGPQELYEKVKVLVKDTVDLSTWERRIQGESLLYDDNANAAAAKQDSPVDERDKQNSSTDVPKQRVVTLGCIGYPNAGKSSVLNALVGKKVVSVSKSPGHTKHFQTIFLTDTVRLCDCPGLVFPSMVPKSLQVIAGIFPVSQVKEPYSVVGYLAKRLDLPRLLNIRPPSYTQQKTDSSKTEWQWSSYDICEAWAVKCGYTTSKAGRPDMYRAANKILRLAVEGQLCLYFRPPGFSVTMEALVNDPELSYLAETLSGRARGRLAQAESSAAVNQEEDEDEEEESESEDDEPEGLEVHGMFEGLSVHDESDSESNSGAKT